METVLDQNPPDTGLSKLNDLAAEAKSVETTTSGFMEPGTKLKNKGGRPPKEGVERDANGRIIRKPKPKNVSSGAGNSASVSPQIGAPETTVSGTQTIPQIQTGEIVKPFLTMASKTAVSFVGHPKAAMEPEEFEAIAKSFGLVLDKWMPLVAGAYGAELLLISSIGAYGMRLAALRAALKVDAEERAHAMMAAQKMSEYQSKAETPTGVSHRTEFPTSAVLNADFPMST